MTGPRLAWAALAVVLIAGCGSGAVVNRAGPAQNARTAASPEAPRTAGAATAAVDRVIVVFKTGTDPATAAQSLASALGVRIAHVYRHALRGAAFTVPAGLGPARFAQDPRVAYAVRDRVMSISAQTMPTGVNRIEADKNPTLRINGVADRQVAYDVAIIDTGIQPDHPDLSVQGGYNATTALTDQWQDGNGHGTHVGGTVAALDNAQGVVGVAPGARLWAVKVLTDAGVGFLSDVAAGVDWVIRRKQDFKAGRPGGINFAVANMSLGGEGTDDGQCGGVSQDPLHTAICAAVDEGIVVVVAAGNDSVDAKDFTPAAYDEVVTVSAIVDWDGKAGGAGTFTCRPTGTDDTFASFSNFGADVDIAAPGRCILSTYLLGTYTELSGTSMASPHVAGTVLVYLHANRRAPATNRRGVERIRNAVISAGLAQTHRCGFSGDPDAFPEPLVFANAKSLRGTGACDVVTAP